MHASTRERATSTEPRQKCLSKKKQRHGAATTLCDREGLDLMACMTSHLWREYKFAAQQCPTASDVMCETPESDRKRNCRAYPSAYRDRGASEQRRHSCRLRGCHCRTADEDLAVIREAPYNDGKDDKDDKDETLWAAQMERKDERRQHYRRMNLVLLARPVHNAAWCSRYLAS